MQLSCLNYLLLFISLIWELSIGETMLIWTDLRPKYDRQVPGIERTDRLDLIHNSSSYLLNHILVTIQIFDTRLVGLKVH